MQTFKKIALSIIAVVITGGMMLTGCNGSGGSGSKSDSTANAGSSDDNTLLGAGATFPNPLYSQNVF